jgi:hypothetical protein
MTNERKKLQEYIELKNKEGFPIIEMTQNEKEYLRIGYENMSNMAGDDEHCQKLCNNVIIHNFHLIYPDFTLTDNQIISFVRTL